MHTIVILVAALLPAVVLWNYVWKKDPIPEPGGQLLKALGYGIAICLPVAFLELALQGVFFGEDLNPTSFLGSTVDAFFVAALPEESAKLLALWLVLRKNPYFDEHYDGIVYAVSVGLGFAAVENFFYLLNEENWLQVAITRGLLAVPGHYAFAVLMGYYYSVYHFVDHSPRNAFYILFVPFMAHGIYDALIMGGQVAPVIGVLGFLTLIWFCTKMQKAANAKITALIEKDRQDGQEPAWNA